jgi:hypothetical protein
MKRDPSELPFRERLEVDAVFAAEVDARAVEAMTPRRSEEWHDISDSIWLRGRYLGYWAAFEGAPTAQDGREAVSSLKALARLWPRIDAEFHRIMRERDSLARQLRTIRNRIEERDDVRPTA